MVVGAIISVVSMGIGYLVQEVRIKRLQSKIEDANNVIEIMKEIEKQNLQEPDNFYDM